MTEQQLPEDDAVLDYKPDAPAEHSVRHRKVYFFLLLGVLGLAALPEMLEVDGQQFFQVFAEAFGAPLAVVLAVAAGTEWLRSQQPGKHFEFNSFLAMAFSYALVYLLWIYVPIVVVGVFEGLVIGAL